jgi:TPR repeat protein
MIVDPLLLYTSKKKMIVDPELVRIFELDKTQCDAVTAHRYFDNVQQAAEAGSGFAMCMLARLFQAGWGRPKSGEEAFRWAKKASEIEFAPGDYEFGKCYDEGIGTVRDLELARKYYELATKGEFGFAAFRLAQMYHSGQFGALESGRAFYYAIRSYELGEMLAPLEIGRWYEDGDGVSKSVKEATFWFERAAEMGNFFASHRLHQAYSFGELGLTKNAEMARKYEEMLNFQLSSVKKDRVKS